MWWCTRTWCLPLFVGREKSIEALEDAMANDKQVLLVAQRNASEDDPGLDDIYQVGTVSTILQLLKLPDGTIKVLVEGGYRAAIDERIDDEAPLFRCRQRHRGNRERDHSPRRGGGCCCASPCPSLKSTST